MERPKVTQELIADAARQAAAENGWDADMADQLAQAYRPGIDGYELAKELESRFLWSISAQDVESLDVMETEVRMLHHAKCIEWVAQNGIQPPVPIGTMTTRGEITGISDYLPAYYLVREHGQTDESRRLLIPFEDARAVSPA